MDDDAVRHEIATYAYHDENGELLFEVVRYQPKGFAQRRPDGTGGWIWNLDQVRRVLYRLPEILAADPNEPVFIVEGEKDVDALRALGLAATTNPGGAGKWRSEYGESLRGRQVVALPDNDAVGTSKVLRHCSPRLPLPSLSSPCPGSLSGVMCRIGSRLAVLRKSCAA